MRPRPQGNFRQPRPSWWEYVGYAAGGLFFLAAVVGGVYAIRAGDTPFGGTLSIAGALGIFLTAKIVATLKSKGAA